MLKFYDITNMKEEACFPEDPFFCSQASLYDEPSDIAVVGQSFKYEHSQEVFDQKSPDLPLSSDGSLDSEGNDDGDASEPVVSKNKPEKNNSIILCKKNPVTKNKSKRIKKICPFLLYFASQKIPIQKTRFKEKLYTEIYNWNTLDIEKQRSFRELTCDVVQHFEDACHDSRVKQILKCPYIPIKNELLDGFYLYAAENRSVLKKQKQSVTQKEMTYVLKLLWNSFSVDLKEYYNNKALSMNHDCNKHIELEVFYPQDDENFNDYDSECNPSEIEEYDSNSSGMQVYKDDGKKMTRLGTDHAAKAKEFARVENEALRDIELKFVSNDDMQDPGYESLSTSPDICKTLQDTVTKKCHTGCNDYRIVKYFEDYLPFTRCNVAKHSVNNFFSYNQDEITDDEDRKVNLDYRVFYSNFHNESFSPEVNGLVYDTEFGSLSSEISDAEFGFNFELSRTLAQCESDFSYDDLFLTQKLLPCSGSNVRNYNGLIYDLISYKDFFNGIESAQCLLSLLSFVEDDPYKCLLNSQEYKLTNSCSPSTSVEMESGKLNEDFVIEALYNPTNECVIRPRKFLDPDSYVYIDFDKNIYYDRVNRTIKGFSDFKLFNSAVGKATVVSLQQPQSIYMKQNMTGFMIFSFEFQKILKEKNPDLASEQMKSLSNSIWMNLSEPEKKEYESLASINNRPWTSDDTKKNLKLRSNAKRDIFICLECDKKFHKPPLLNQHARVSHKTFKAFRCVLCFEMLSSSTCLAKHCRLIHRPVHSQRYTCEICLGTFAKEAHLNRHSRLKICTHPIMGFPFYCYEQQLKEFNANEICKDPLHIMSYEKECWNSVKSILEPDSAADNNDYDTSQIDDGYNSNSAEFPTNDDAIIEENFINDEESCLDRFEKCPDFDIGLKSEINHHDLNDVDNIMLLQDIELVDQSMTNAFRKYLIHFSEKESHGKVQPIGEKLGIFAHSGILELYAENEEIRTEVEEFSLHTEDVSLSDILMEEYVIKYEYDKICSTIKAPPSKTKKRKKTKESPSIPPKRNKSISLVDRIECGTSHPSNITDNNFMPDMVQISDIDDDGSSFGGNQDLRVDGDVKKGVLGHCSSYGSHTLDKDELIIQDVISTADNVLNSETFDNDCEESITLNVDCSNCNVNYESICNAKCQNKSLDVDIPDKNMNSPSLKNETHKATTAFSEVGKMALQDGVWKWKQNVKATEDSSVTESQKVKVASITADPKGAMTDFNFLEHDAGGRSDNSEGADEDNVMEVDILQAAISDIFEMEDFAFAVDEEPS